VKQKLQRVAAEAAILFVEGDVDYLKRSHAELHLSEIVCVCWNCPSAPLNASVQSNQGAQY
jgi:hypothetical protein